MHRLHKVSKANTSGISFRRIPWFVLDAVVFAGLSLWIGFRRMSNVISSRSRRS
jgi:hypothetical protein